MRTTLDIDDDVLEAAKSLAQQSNRTAGAVLSELARRTLTSARPPASTTQHEGERIIVELWKELLGRDDIGVHDDFFELGGHSLLAIKFLLLLGERVGVELPAEILFESPTAAALAARLTLESQTARIGASDRGVDGPLINQREDSIAARSGITSIDELLDRQLDFVRTWKGTRATPESFIVTLNDSGGHQGLFWCLQGYRELTQLALHLGSAQPVHGMRSGHLIMKYTDENVSALASHYAAEMIALQPDGPFLLGGNCQGGIIARVIAQQLRDHGRTVSLLILMEQESFPPYEGPVALIFGGESDFNPYTPDADPDAVFRRSYPAGFTVDIISGAHGKFFEPPNVNSLATAINRGLSAHH
jgi:phosphopantetheine binding protein/thioesterase superfamily protein